MNGRKDNRVYGANGNSSRGAAATSSEATHRHSSRQSGQSLEEETRRASTLSWQEEGIVDPVFERAYAQMMERALKESRGERKRRLLENHGRGERMLVARVLWPVLGSLEHLHPEYEIRDLSGGVNFVDYAYIPSSQLELLLECDGFGPRWRDISRWDFDRQEERQNQLLLDEWRLLRFSFDGIMEKTERCRNTVRMALAKWGQMTVGSGEEIYLGVYERAILHYGLSNIGQTLTPTNVAQELGTNRHTVTKYMRMLEKKGWLSPVYSPTGKTMGYRLAPPRSRR